MHLKNDKKCTIYSNLVGFIYLLGFEVFIQTSYMQPKKKRLPLTNNYKFKSAESAR
jgi:hypothetical protein